MKREQVSFRDEKLVKAVRRLYLKYDGCQLMRITREIRASGWPTFSQTVLTNRSGSKKSPGWIERFGWRKDLERKRKRAEQNAARRTAQFERWLEEDPSKMKWTAKHHVHICKELRKITEGEMDRLMLFVPPRHGKSELVTVRYAVWRLAREPKINIIIGCYNQKLANRFSRKIKKLAAKRTAISRSRFAAEEWETAAGGSVKAVGVGAGITGYGGDLIIIDDPVRGRADSKSITIREKTWDWYCDDIHTRLEPGASIILIQTRWHADDLAGRLLKDMQDEGEQWTVVKLPALAEGDGERQETGEERREEGVRSPVSCLTSPVSSDPLGRKEGEALWPERFDREVLLKKKRQQGAWSFASLYQQRPIPEGNTLFKHSWFENIVNKCPEGLRWGRGYDLAVSIHERADYTASFRCALDKRTGTLYIADGFRKRIEYPEQKAFVIERMQAEGNTAHGIELALHGKALLQDLRREATLLGCVLRGVKVDGDKLMRAEAWSGYAEEGKIVLVNGPWISDFVEEACRFTGRGDAHDDQIDAVSLAVRMLSETGKSGTSF